MKKAILFVCGGLAAGLAWGQTSVPNSSFENWTTAANGTDSLIGWSSSNSVVIAPVVSLRKDTLNHEGTYAAHISTAPFGFVQYTTIGALANGSATFTYGGGGGGANVEYAGGGGTPIAYKPTELRGHYLYNTLAQQGDQGVAHVLLSKYNTGLNRRDTVSYGQHYFIQNDIYAPFSILLTDYMPTVTPDSITVLFYSSNAFTVAPNDVWSDLYLDELSLFPPIHLSVNGEAPVGEMELFPNPAVDRLTIRKTDEQATVFEVYDNVGKQLLALRMQAYEKEFVLDVSSLPAGMYYLKSGQNGSEYSRKFVIHK